MLDRMNNMAARLRYEGGFPQQNRMIKDKRHSMDQAIKYSYQGATVRKLSEKRLCPALINPNKTKQDYDDKIISIGYEFGYNPGDIFEWCGTKTKWLIYLQDLTELAYFRGDIRKCSYAVKWLNSEGKECETYFAVRGPVETKIDFIQKNGISVDNPNHSLHILMPKNKDTVEYFVRYAKFYLQDLPEGDKNTCWRVEATDTLSMPGILEITAVEYFANEQEDDLSTGIAKALIPEKEDIPSEISGPTFIKPKKTIEFEWPEETEGEWSWDKKLPIKAKINGNIISILWNSTYSGQFELFFTSTTGEKYSKTIIVESLF